MRQQRCRPEGAGRWQALQARGHCLHPGGGGVPRGAPPHGGGPAESAGQGGLHEDRGGGGDRLQPPAEQGLNDPHEGLVLDGAEQELK